MDIATENETVPTPMEQINEAYKEIKFGRFHIKLLIIGFFGTVSTLLVTNTTSYLLPNAECDLGMDLVEKGLLTSAPYFGMLMSSIIAGFLTDTFGRKIFLVLGFGGIFTFNLISASSQSYEVLLTAKLFEGMLFAMAVTVLVSLTSEFCHSEIRDRMMLCQSSFIAISSIIIPAMAWGILTQDWRYSFFDGYFVLNTWNIYLYAMSLWSLAACIMYSTLPESPKFLITQKKYGEARAILVKMYKENTGKPADTFQFADLWKDKETKDDDVTQDKQPVKERILRGLRNVKPIFRRPLILYLVMMGAMNFLILGKYNVIRLWFPQLSTIVEHYKLDGNSDLCVLLDTYTSDLRAKRLNITKSDICIPAKSGAETYINSIIIGFACLIPYFITGALVNKVGKKYLMVGAALLCIGATTALRWANSKLAVVSLFATDMAVSQIMKSLLQAFVVEFFPTTVRNLALSFTMTSARVGTLVSGILFPILLNMKCVIPFFSLSGVVVCVALISLILPKKKN